MIAFMDQEPRTIVLLGRSGSGKDTQMALLKERLDSVMVVGTGDLVRSLRKRPTLIGRKTRELYDAGGLLPAWLASYLWQRELADNLEGNEHLIFPSSPRRTAEAEELDEVMAWLDRKLPEAVLIDITDDEAVRRILKRSRDASDNEADIRERLAWFQKDVLSTITYYESKGRLHHINGMGTVEEIFDRIQRALGLT